MKPLKASIPLFIILLVLTHIPFVYAPDGIDLSEIPQRLADSMNVPLLAGQLLASALILAMFLFPTLLLTNKYNSQSVAVLIMGVSVMGFLIAVSWLPYWFLLIIVLIVALMYSGKMRDFFPERKLKAWGICQNTRV